METKVSIASFRYVTSNDADPVTIDHVECLDGNERAIVWSGARSSTAGVRLGLSCVIP